MEMNGATSTRARSLSTNLAFVVHLTADPASSTAAGRVEHVSSGATARFTTTEDLLGFMRRTVAALTID
jgi:hypothetical protein